MKDICSLYTGSRVAQNRARALELWTTVSQVRLPDGVTIEAKDEMARAYARVKADAYSYLCAHHLRSYEKSKSLSDLAQAFLCAEGAAKLELFGACCHYTALALYKLQDGLPTTRFLIGSLRRHLMQRLQKKSRTR